MQGTQAGLLLICSRKEHIAIVHVERDATARAGSIPLLENVKKCPPFYRDITIPTGI